MHNIQEGTHMENRSTGRSRKRTRKRKRGCGPAVIAGFLLLAAVGCGMGNLAGVVAAISFGGAGAVFWMWLTALIGSSSSFIESTLAQIYKEKDPLYGGYRGGPAYVMDRIRLVTKIKREDAFVINTGSGGPFCQLFNSGSTESVCCS